MAVLTRVANTCVFNGERIHKFRVHSQAELENAPTDSSTQSTLERLDILTPSSTANTNTIRNKLVEAHGSNQSSSFSVPLVFTRTRKPSISVQRNIRRQEYLNKVSQRDYSRTFATIGLFVLGPPIVILGAAIASGYVQLDVLGIGPPVN